MKKLTYKQRISMRLKMNDRETFFENVKYACVYVQRIDLRFYFDAQLKFLYETNIYQAKQIIAAVADYSSKPFCIGAVPR